jgi:glycerol-3-phosphate cytidylyltransferase
VTVVGYASGVFDMFHVGHLNILRRAKLDCDYLIAGVVTDDVVEQIKGRRPVVPLFERMEIVQSVRFVDEVVPDDTVDKFHMWERLRFDVFFKGDDWRGTPKGDRLESALQGVGARLSYLPYTADTSSTLLRKLITAERD